LSQTILITDSNMGDPRFEREVAEDAGLALLEADCHTEEEVIAAAAQAEPVALLVQYAPITRRVFAASPSILVVGRYGVGLDCVDLEAAAEHSVEVVNVVDYGSTQIADHAFALLLALVRNLSGWTSATKLGHWPAPTDFPLPQELDTLRLGVLGFGRIGSAVAERARGLGLDVVASDPYLDSSEIEARGAHAVGLEELWSMSDAVSLHAPLTPETEHVLDETAFGRFREGSYIVNTARAGLIERQALERALDDGPLRGAGLDVWWEEPPSPDDPLLRHPRVLVTPHAAWLSEGSFRRLRTAAARRVVEALAVKRAAAERALS
jgi:D-3-phosphoglycerate dehydrogenase